MRPVLWAAVWLLFLLRLRIITASLDRDTASGMGFIGSGHTIHPSCAERSAGIYTEKLIVIKKMPNNNGGNLQVRTEHFN